MFASLRHNIKMFFIKRSLDRVEQKARQERINYYLSNNLTPNMKDVETYAKNMVAMQKNIISMDLVIKQQTAGNKIINSALYHAANPR